MAGLRPSWRDAPMGRFAAMSPSGRNGKPEVETTYQEDETRESVTLYDVPIYSFIPQILAPWLRLSENQISFYRRDGTINSRITQRKNGNKKSSLEYHRDGTVKKYTTYRMNGKEKIMMGYNQNQMTRWRRQFRKDGNPHKQMIKFKDGMTQYWYWGKEKQKTIVDYDRDRTRQRVLEYGRRGEFLREVRYAKDGLTVEAISGDRGEESIAVGGRYEPEEDRRFFDSWIEWGKTIFEKSDSWFQNLWTKIRGWNLKQPLENILKRIGF